MMRAVAFLGAACLVLVACAEEMPPSTAEQLPPGEARPFVVQVRQGDFTLTWRIDAQRVSSRDALALEARLLYTGPLPRVDALAGFSLVNFYLEQVDGPLRLDPAIESIGICHEIRPNEVIVVPYRKSGGFAEPGDPNFPIMNEFLEDPELHVPPGRWRITAIADFTFACGEGQALHIEAPGEIIVSP